MEGEWLTGKNPENSPEMIIRKKREFGLGGQGQKTVQAQGRFRRTAAISNQAA